MTCTQVMQLLVLCLFHQSHAMVELLGHGSHTSLYRLQLACHRHLGIVFNDRRVEAIGHIADGSHGLQLSGAFVDAGDTCIAVDALAGILKHESTATVYLYAVVSVLVGIFAVHTLSQRSKCIGQLAEFLHLCTLLRSEFALTCDILQSLVDVHVASSLI